MNIIGRQKITKALIYDNEEAKWLTEEDARQTDNFDSELCNTIMDFKPDGTLIRMMKLPEDTSQEQIDEAIA